MKNSKSEGLVFYYQIREQTALVPSATLLCDFGVTKSSYWFARLFAFITIILFVRHFKIASIEHMSAR